MNKETKKLKIACKAAVRQVCTVRVAPRNIIIHATMQLCRKSVDRKKIHNFYSLQYTIQTYLFLTFSFQNFIYICWHYFLRKIMSLIQRSWPRFSEPLKSHLVSHVNHIYVIAVVKFSNRSIPIFLNFDK